MQPRGGEGRRLLLVPHQGPLSKVIHSRHHFSPSLLHPPDHQLPPHHHLPLLLRDVSPQGAVVSGSSSAPFLSLSSPGNLNHISKRKAFSDAIQVNCFEQVDLLGGGASTGHLFKLL